MTTVRERVKQQSTNGDLPTPATRPRNSGDSPTPVTRLRSTRKHVQPLAWTAIAALTLLAGYADLWRGGHTVSALLLTVGYLVLVPVAMLAVPRTARGTQHR